MAILPTLSVALACWQADEERLRPSAAAAGGAGSTALVVEAIQKRDHLHHVDFAMSADERCRALYMQEKPRYMQGLAL